MVEISLSPELTAPLTFRQQEPQDTSFLYRLFVASRSHEFDAVEWEHDQREAFFQSQFALQTRQYESACAPEDRLVFQIKEELIGRLLLSRMSDDLRIVDIALLPDFRAKGFGSLIMRALKASAMQHSPAGTISLHVHEQNRAMAFYTHNGFVISAVSPPFLRMIWPSTMIVDR